MKTKEVEDQLIRIGVNARNEGPTPVRMLHSTLCVATHNGQVRIYDDYVQWVGDGEELLDILQSLPEGSGSNALWEALKKSNGQIAERQL